MELHYPKKKNNLVAKTLFEMTQIQTLCLASLDGSFVLQKNLVKTFKIITL